VISARSPEIYSAVEVARAALYRTSLTFNITQDMDDAAKVLGLALYKSYLRHIPFALESVARHGPEALERAVAYREFAGMVDDPFKPRMVRMPPGIEQRKTPPEIRRLWKCCEAPVEETFLGLSPNTKKALTLNLSWGLHKAMYLVNPAYREIIDETRRMQRQRRYMA
jgi:hypothetical protein